MKLGRKVVFILNVRLSYDPCHSLCRVALGSETGFSVLFGKEKKVRIRAFSFALRSAV
jgi:hypothetical protein